MRLTYMYKVAFLTLPTISILKVFNFYSIAQNLAREYMF